MILVYCLLAPEPSGLVCHGPRSGVGPPARSQLRPTEESSLPAGRGVVLGEDRAEGEEHEGRVCRKRSGAQGRMWGVESLNGAWPVDVLPDRRIRTPRWLVILEIVNALQGMVLAVFPALCRFPKMFFLKRWTIALSLESAKPFAGHCFVKFLAFCPPFKCVFL